MAYAAYAAYEKRPTSGEYNHSKVIIKCLFLES